MAHPLRHGLHRPHLGLFLPEVRLLTCYFPKGEGSINFLNKSRDYTRDNIPPLIDFNDNGYAGHIWLYIFCGLLDSMWQTASYWFMGALSNDPAKLAYLTGFCAYFPCHLRRYAILLTPLPLLLSRVDKSLQSAGAAGVWRADAVGIPYV